MALMEFARSRRESTRVPSRSKMSSLILSMGMGRFFRIIAAPSISRPAAIPESATKAKSNTTETRSHGESQRQVFGDWNLVLGAIGFVESLSPSVDHQPLPSTKFQIPVFD